MSSTNITKIKVQCRARSQSSTGDMIYGMGRRDSFGRRLFMLRRDMKLTQTDVIERLAQMGVSIGQTYMSTLENSEDRTPTGEVVAGLARVLETSADYLLMLSDDPLPVEKRGEIEAIGISPQAEELARIADRLPPFRRDELLAHARIIEQMERDSERDVKAAVDAMVATLRLSGSILGDDALRTIHAGIVDYTAALLGSNAVAAIEPLTSSDTGRSRRKAQV
jgi:transcriptional regulator with XRE-family HTH domain